MPDHYWIDRHRGVVSMTECYTTIQAVAEAAGKQVRSASGAERGTRRISFSVNGRRKALLGLQIGLSL
ncbi:hypothetical protein EAS62_15090 [Bradyrhizobium zhanjiangense]|uniref:Uncharacterized protein n=1 Tax=Bradyrhizobium zhanjiangense TaxID=1325107 RepID=A0ABY0DKS3_9BRAD|nr:hypothetical protein EAS62_15090 [Bradyrhizobium zhanjiangense]